MIESFFQCYNDHLGEKGEHYWTYLAVDKPEMYDVAKKHFNSSRLITFPSYIHPNQPQEGEKGMASIGHSDKCRLGDCDFVRERTIVEHFLLQTVDSLLTSWSGFSTTAASIGGQYDAIAIGSFCNCVKGRTIHDFMETRHGRRVPLWTREKCEKYNPGSTIRPAKSSITTKEEEEEEEERGHNEEEQLPDELEDHHDHDHHDHEHLHDHDHHEHHEHHEHLHDHEHFHNHEHLREHLHRDREH
eukprot:CAMPEP_0201543076 /NCGR_PEP_ID=MMETSP0161_2-20130828/72386_1 /ASSEMBLY_ACC=CAM_ASM_000251 /TAXON_ID=180227 /ORGANISM="Neoparamoeba aestuarina, Strain SoJaBio B1-5/56/2" /LENGTH=243 /DNA_ID=CAMNT_0047950793 /DNA_START=643 /DNA_END=1374 /DNA_ORIENTATION=-